MEPKKLDAEHLAWFEELARSRDAVHPGELLGHIAALEAESAQERKALQTRLELATRLAEDANKHRSEAMQRVTELEAELARLKPSGQVAEDVETVKRSVHLLRLNEECCDGACEHHAALSRLAAKAQGHDALLNGEEAHEAVLSDLAHILSQDEGEDTLAAAQRVVSERDAAVADNAALARVARAVREITKDVAENGNCADCPYVSPEEAAALLAIIDAPHPGVALLERMKRLEDALHFIAAWTLPRVPDSMDPSKTVSYSFAYGSNGEREYMRDIAAKALIEESIP